MRFLDDPEFTRRVAHTYGSALAAGKPPTQAVQQAFDVPYSTAGRWIRAARDAGQLPGASAGGPKRRNRKLVNVAAALGVEVTALQRAILEHADGDLRVSLLSSLSADG